MKILVLNGSPRLDGNTKTALNTIVAGINKIYNADTIIFGSPIYWWGVSAQLKMIIDKMYSKSEQFQEQKKKIGLVTVGADELKGPQYRIISEQMECICEYLGWELVFSHPISTYEKTDVLNNSDELRNLGELWKKIS